MVLRYQYIISEEVKNLLERDEQYHKMSVMRAEEFKNTKPTMESCQTIVRVFNAHYREPKDLLPEQIEREER